MPVGFPTKVNYATGDVLSATNMNDLSGTVNLLESAAESAAGVNKIINGDFGIWQRGTSFTANGYTADRWSFDADGTGSTNTISQQTFTPGTAPVSGYEGTYYLRIARSAVGSSNTYNQLKQAVEDVRTFAGQTVTVSFWAKADSARTLTAYLFQNYGSGGSTTTGGSIGTASVTTAWTRFTLTSAVASISGKTIGTSSYLQLLIACPAAVASTIEFWGVQLEASSTASDFKTATGTKQGELAACQRYFQRVESQSNFGNSYSTTDSMFNVAFPSSMRIAPTGTFLATYVFQQFGTADKTGTAISAGSSTTTRYQFAVTGATTLTIGLPTSYKNYVDLSSEL